MGRAQPTAGDQESKRAFMKHVLNDARALEAMIADGMVENDRRRIGVEQEMFLVDEKMRPANLVVPILKELADDQFVTELGAFNLEANSDTYVFGEDCLSRLEAELLEKVARARAAAAKFGGNIVLVGSLPTLKKSDLGLDNMAPVERYRQLNDIMSDLRGEPYEFRITGIDELIMEHDSVMTEACNTSFQVHFQVGPAEFAELYNVAQVCNAPLMAAACNSPLLFGKRLWRETRIALFQQSIDLRRNDSPMRDLQPRVTFGSSWVKKSVMELIREDITRFKVLIASHIDEDAFEALREGRAPSLKALRMLNGTIYRWNRACYGITEGKPHLRIENRILPSGPTVADEVANTAFWCGLMSAVSRHWQDVTQVMDFDDAKANFFAAARLGLAAQFRWLDGKLYPAQKLILDIALPLAKEGLSKKGIAEADINRYLGIIERRVASGQTGAEWLLKSYTANRSKGRRSERLAEVTNAYLRNQTDNRPVHEWDEYSMEEPSVYKSTMTTVDDYMSTDFVTVQEDELVDLVACLMDWHKIRHVLVENQDHELVGLVSHRCLIKLFAKGMEALSARNPSVSEIMIRNLVTCPPEMSTLDAVRLMSNNKVGALPVVKDGQLVGLITERDLMPLASQLLEEKFGG
ncbi:MAG: glutamate-cysteine ligase family protein [Candidatus Sumerlaeia bacterium]|nr:glutamate-cysteine ligase family protein [Candidatus Sumerlaeia bacterium]